MMKKLAFFLTFVCAFSINAQTGNVGINTASPTESLDVNGTLRVRKIPSSGTPSNASVKDSIMVFDADGLVRYVSGDKILQQTTAGNVKVLTDATLKGDGATGNVLGIAQQGATTGQVLKWTGTSWIPATEAAASNWLLTGNSNATTSNFLGTTTDVLLSLRSNNTPMFEVGRRQTLGLYDSGSTGLFPYNQQNASVAYVRGTGGNSALQFEASGASFYKPVIFTDADGNFMMRGSSAGTDFFELGSSGTTNSGQLTFTIGDDGDEPMLFRKYNYSPAAYVELMRLQGTGLNNNVRAGINVAGTTANSTLQVVGSVSVAITTLSAATTLNETHHTIILTNNSAITLPAANSCTGRVYVIKKTSTSTATISSYSNSIGTSVTTIPQGVIRLQSDGATWQQIN